MASADSKPDPETRTQSRSHKERAVENVATLARRTARWDRLDTSHAVYMTVFGASAALSLVGFCQAFWQGSIHWLTIQFGQNLASRISSGSFGLGLMFGPLSATGAWWAFSELRGKWSRIATEAIDDS